MLVAYKLIISELHKPKLSTEKLEFTRCFSGQLKFRDASGVQFVHESKSSTLKVFEVNEHVLCIVEEGDFQKHEIYNSLISYHRAKITNEIKKLNKIKKNL